MGTKGIAALVIVFSFGAGAASVWLMNAKEGNSEKVTAGRKSKIQLNDKITKSNIELQKKNEKLRLELAKLRTLNKSKQDKSPPIEKRINLKPVTQKDKTIKSAGKSSSDMNAIPSADEIKRKQEENSQRIVHLIETRLGSEDIDENWALSARDKINETMGNKQFASSTISEIDCRSSMCKIVLQHNSSTAQSTFAENFIRLGGYRNIDAYLVRDTQVDGSIKTTMYLSRDGKTLPVK